MLLNDYQEPKTIEEAEDRLTNLKIVVMEIEYRLATTSITKFQNQERYDNPEREFMFWKLNSKKARVCRLQEQELLKMWIRHKKREASIPPEEKLYGTIIR